MRENCSDFNKYPHRIFANALLHEGKIIDWKTGSTRWELLSYNPKVSLRTKSFVVKNDKEHSRVFNKDSEKFYRKFPIHPNFKGFMPYEN
ncbi:MAG TPA: hypothetical protein VHO03_16585 [Ignavibacteriales bacterium]|nr:hypothetical protein [Ignavibacteriales bacterium]